MLQNYVAKIKRRAKILIYGGLGRLSPDERYKKKFYLPRYHGKEKAARKRKTAQLIMEAFDFSSVLDLGCYVGYFIDEFQKAGKEVFGVEGDWVDRDVFLPSVRDKIVLHNLEKPLDLGRKFDLVLSLEVAENIYPGTEETFLENIIRHTKSYIIFSAAKVGELGGPLHQHRCFHPPSWWASKIEEFGAKYLLHDTAKFATLLQVNNCPGWYINSVSVFKI